MIEAVAQAAEVPAPEVRRALMLGGSLPAVARAALCGFADPLGASVPPGTAAGPADALSALRSFTLRVGRPLRPMLAAAAPTIAAALQKVSPAAIEWKIDGIRVQVHKDRAEVAVFTRTLDDITARVPEIAEAVLALPAASAVLDGEAVALYPDGRPRPFQVTASRAGTRTEVESRRGDVPLTPFFFDLLHLDGTDLIDAPAEERFAALARLLPAGLGDPAHGHRRSGGAEAFFADAVTHGHEGVVLKSLGSPYAAGRRGSEWIKVKPRAHPRPRRARGRVGSRAAARLAVQPAPRRQGSGDRRPGDARQDLQGPDRPDAGLADRTVARAGRSRAGLADRRYGRRRHGSRRHGSRRHGSRRHGSRRCGSRPCRGRRCGPPATWCGSGQN